MNYADLPDGTILKTRDGREWVKGPHPKFDHIRPSATDPVVGWRERNYDDGSCPNWCSWNAAGEAWSSCGERYQDLDIVAHGPAPVIGFPPIVARIAIPHEESLGHMAITQYVSNISALITDTAKQQMVTLPQRKAGVKPAISGLTTMLPRTHKFGENV